jgi:hypothetical protein
MTFEKGGKYKKKQNQFCIFPPLGLYEKAKK